MQLSSASYPVKFGPVLKGTHSNISIIGEASNNIIVRRGLTFLKFTKKLTIAQQKDILLKTGKKDKKIERISIINNKIVIFSSFKDKKAKIKTLYYDIFSPKTLSREGTSKELTSFEEGKGFFKPKGNFRVVFSGDKSKVAVFINLPYKKGGKEKFNYMVFDEEMEELIKGKIELPMLDSKLKLGSIHVTNEGELFIGALETIGDKQSGYKTKNHIYLLADGELVDNTFDLPDGKYINNFTFNSNDEGYLVLVGYYGEKDFKGIRGAFYLRYNIVDQDIEQFNTSQFPDKFYVEGFTDKQKKKANNKKNGPSFNQFQIRHLVPTKDGGAVLVSEQYYYTVHTYRTSNGATRTVYTYYYNDILISKLNEDGEFDWNQKIRKSQISQNDGGYYSSFAFHYDDDNLYFMYNDTKKNYTESGKPLPEGSKLYRTNFGKKNNVTSIITVNIEEQNKKKEQLFGKTDIGTIAVPKIYYSDKKENKLYFYTKIGKKERLGQVSFE
jgi:hypothetical protein